MKDINDNAPSFGQDHFNIDIPENIPSGTLRKLPPAKDPDLDGVQKYEIVQGNTEEVFDLKYDKDTLDLVSYTYIFLGIAALRAASEIIICWCCLLLVVSHLSFNVRKSFKTV